MSAVVRSLIPWAVLFVLISVGVFLLNREHGLRTTAERNAEASRLILQGQTVELENTRKQLDGNVQELLRRDVELQAAVEQAKKTAPDLKPVSASRLDTGPLKVQTPKPAGPAAGTTSAGGAGSSSEGAICKDCALTYSDQIDLQVTVLELQTKLQNTVVVGTAEVYRVEPRVLLASGRFQSALSSSRQLEVPAPPRWGAFVLGACGSGGCGPGGGVLFPPATVLGVRLEAMAGAVAAPSGLQGVAGVGIRW